MRPEISTQEPIAYQQQIATKSARELQQLVDNIDNEITNFENIRLPGSQDTRYQANLRNLRGMVKEQLHQIDPNGLGAADISYANYASKAEPLSRLGNDAQLESFINNYYGKNKELTRQAAKEIIPESIPSLEHMAASKAFESTGPSGSALGRRSVIGGSLVGAGGSMVASGKPIEGGLIALSSLATNPNLNKQVIGRGSQLVDYLQQNPELLKLLQSTGGQSVWQNILNKENK